MARRDDSVIYESMVRTTVQAVVKQLARTWGRSPEQVCMDLSSVARSEASGAVSLSLEAEEEIRRRGMDPFYATVKDANDLRRSGGRSMQATAAPAAVESVAMSSETRAELRRRGIDPDYAEIRDAKDLEARRRFREGR